MHPDKNKNKPETKGGVISTRTDPSRLGPIGLYGQMQFVLFCSVSSVTNLWTGLETTWGSAIKDRIFVFGWYPFEDTKIMHLNK